MLLLREVELFVVVVVVGPSDVSCFRIEFVLFQLLLLRVPCRAIAGRKKGKKNHKHSLFCGLFHLQVVLVIAATHDLFRPFPSPHPSHLLLKLSTPSSFSCNLGWDSCLLPPASSYLTAFRFLRPDRSPLFPSNYSPFLPLHRLSRTLTPRDSIPTTNYSYYASSLLL